MQVELGAPRVDQHFAGIVIQKKRHVRAFRGHLHPLATSAAAFPLPGYGAVVVAGALRNGGHHCVRARSQAIEFDQLPSDAQRILKRAC